jgi:hypothetical protein
MVVNMDVSGLPTTYRTHLLGRLNFLKMGPTGQPETPVINFRPMLRKIEKRAALTYTETEA